MEINMLLKETVERDGSDLHLGVGEPPIFRVHGELVRRESEVMSNDTVRTLIYSMLKPDQTARFEKEKELDIAFGIQGLGRFRVNVYMQRESIGAAVRVLPFKIRTFAECGLPFEVVSSFCGKQKGLVLVTGATGSGKSTTLASMIEEINSVRHSHIITVEDPVEYVYENKKSLIEQREIGRDTNSFVTGLKYILRQDPDVILIGEMRDLETIEAALTIAETGHLVFATLHTSDSVQTVNRIVDVFPAHQQQQIRVQLSFVVLGIISQQLIPRSDGNGRVLGVEVLVANHAVRSLIRESKAHQIYSAIQTGMKEGMSTMNQSLMALCENGDIAYENALSYSNNPTELEKLMGRDGEK